MIFAETAQTLNQTKEKERLTGGPRVNGPHTSETREQRHDLTARDLVDGEVSAMAKGTIVLPTPFRIE